MSSLPGLPQIRTVNEVVVGSSGNVDPCGVQDLPPELMYNIFLQNTEHDHYSHNRLNTARYCSQVCQSWRSLLLSSPTIWGRLLKAEYFRNTTRGRVWAREVLSRAGDALLWVETLSANPADPDFIVQWILKEKWENVQFASLEFPNMDPEEKWSFLGKESPNLESLRVVVYHRLRPLAVPALFSNVAPRLRAFHLPGCFKFPNAPLCLSNLRILTLDTECADDNFHASINATPHSSSHTKWFVPYAR
ncbi:hypothetical protein CPC08DRAFT_769207 [Agrocybe pediades]|nr:hypothetical protein CPC08DRAFT_769207 [Agrocybe pediades]